MASANVGACLSGAWTIYKNNFLTHAVAAFLVSAVAGISGGLLAGPMLVGQQRMVAKEEAGGKATIGEVFQGFETFVPALVAGLLSMVVVSVGFMLCVIPGLLIMALPTVALHFVAEGETDGVAAFTRAWRIVTKNLFSSFLCVLVLAIVGSLGSILCGVGVLLTAPLAMIGMHIMARQLTADGPARIAAL